jgi:hypothetical protein
MPPNSKYVAGLNEKECWDAWWEHKTLRKAAQALFERGVKNPKTNGPVTHYGVQLAAWRWACKNIDAAKEDFRKDYESRGVAFDEWEEKAFYMSLMRVSKRIYVTQNSLEKWIVENHLEEYRQYI